LGTCDNKTLPLLIGAFVRDQLSSIDRGQPPRLPPLSSLSPHQMKLICIDLPVLFQRPNTHVAIDKTNISSAETIIVWDDYLGGG